MVLPAIEGKGSLVRSAANARLSPGRRVRADAVGLTGRRANAVVHRWKVNPAAPASRVRRGGPTPLFENAGDAFVLPGKQP